MNTFLSYLKVLWTLKFPCLKTKIGMEIPIGRIWTIWFPRYHGPCENKQQGGYPSIKSTLAWTVATKYTQRPHNKGITALHINGDSLHGKQTPVLSDLNSSPPSAAWMHQWIGSAMVQKITCPIRRQAIIYTNAGLLLIGHLATNFSEILIKIRNFSFAKTHLKIPSKNGGHFVQGEMS